MDIRKLQRAIVDGLEDVKAQEILVLNTEHLSSLFERVIIASGTSNRQTKALASGVRNAVREAGFPVLATEGAENGEWIIVDCGAAVAHIMQPAIREYYRLEEIWGGKTVKMKLGGPAKGLVKASEGAGDGDADEDDEPVAKKPARKAAAKRSAKQAAKPAAPVQPARVAVAAKPEPSQRPASKAAAAKKVAAKVAAAKKVVARKKAIAKAPVLKTIVVKAVDRRTAAAKSVSAAARKTAGPARKTATGGRAAAPSGRKAAAKTLSKPSSKPSTRR